MKYERMFLSLRQFRPAALAHPWLTAVLVVLIGAAGTLWAWRLVEVREMRLVAERLDHLANRFFLDLRRHQAAHELALRAGAGMASVLGDVRHGDWRRLFDTLRVAESLPGVQGYGFARVVSEAELATHVRAVQADGFPNYVVTPHGPRPWYTPIAYLEPYDWRNQLAHGYDMLSEPERARAMRRAAATGETSATGRVRLVQETGVAEQSGFLLYAPAYREKRADETSAFDAVIGFAYSPVRTGDFFEALLSQSDPHVRAALAIEVFDGPGVAEADLIFRSDGVGDASFDLARTLAHDLFGRTWTIRVTPRRAFIAAIDQKARNGILLGGAAISLMGGALVLTVAQRHRQRVNDAARNDMIAREMAHRVKNLLAVIQAIAARTLTGDRPLAEARAAFAHRLAALARTQSALMEVGALGALVRDVLRGELAAFAERVVVSGPAVRATPRSAQSLAMAVHELATNAVKYGALSAPGGVVRATWRVRPDADGTPWFSFVWEENGGPPPDPASRDGFGRVLLRRLIVATAGTEPSVAYGPDGLRYAFECPLERIGQLAPEPADVRRRGGDPAGRRDPG